MTAITPDYQVQVASTRPTAALTSLLATTAAAVAAQAALSGWLHVGPADGSSWWWAKAALHAAMTAGPVALGAWAYLSLTTEGGRSARVVARFLRWSLYVGLLTAVTTASFESARIAGGNGTVVWLLRTLVLLGLPVLLAVYLRKSREAVARYGPSFSGKVGDVQMHSVSRDAAVCVLLMIVTLVGVLTKAAVPSMKLFGWSFLVTSDWRPNPLPGGPALDEEGNAKTDPDTGETMMLPDIPPAFGALPLIWGTAVSSFIALLVAVPLSFGAALFLVRVAPELRPVVFLYFVLGVAITMGLLMVLGGSPLLSVVALVVGVGITVALAALANRYVIPFVTPTSTVLLFQGAAVYGIIACGFFLVRGLIGLSWPWSLAAAAASGLTLWAIAPQVTAAASFLIEFLAAIPSIAYGIWGIFVLAPFLQGRVQPAFLKTYEALPYLGWGHVVLIVLVPLACFALAALAYRLAPPSVPRAAVFVSWLALFLVAVGTAWWGLRLAYNEVLVLPTFDAKVQTTLGIRPTLWWMFLDAYHDGTEMKYRPVAQLGTNMLCGGLILAVMIIPIITAISRDVLRAVPPAQVEGTTALGATWWESNKEMLKFSRSALFGAVMLGLARAAGETMAVTMVIGNNPQIKFSPFMAAQTMSSLLANQFAESGDTQRAALFEVALILLVMSLAFNIVARYLVVGKEARSAAAH